MSDIFPPEPEPSRWRIWWWRITSIFCSHHWGILSYDSKGLTLCCYKCGKYLEIDEGIHEKDCPICKLRDDIKEEVN